MQSSRDGTGDAAPAISCAANLSRFPVPKTKKCKALRHDARVEMQPPPPPPLRPVQLFSHDTCSSLRRSCCTAPFECPNQRARTKLALRRLSPRSSLRRRPLDPKALIGESLLMQRFRLHPQLTPWETKPPRRPQRTQPHAPHRLKLTLQWLAPRTCRLLQQIFPGQAAHLRAAARCGPRRTCENLLLPAAAL